jgi:hypothetical protein
MLGDDFDPIKFDLSYLLRTELARDTRPSFVGVSARSNHQEAAGSVQCSGTFAVAIFGHRSAEYYAISSSLLAPVTRRE